MNRQKGVRTLADIEKETDGLEAVKMDKQYADHRQVILDMLAKFQEVGIGRFG